MPGWSAGGRRRARTSTLSTLVPRPERHRDQEDDPGQQEQEDVADPEPRAPGAAAAAAGAGSPVGRPAAAWGGWSWAGTAGRGRPGRRLGAGARLRRHHPGRVGAGGSLGRAVGAADRPGGLGVACCRPGRRRTRRPSRRTASRTRVLPAAMAVNATGCGPSRLTSARRYQRVTGVTGDTGVSHSLDRQRHLSIGDQVPSPDHSRQCRGPRRARAVPSRAGADGDDPGGARARPSWLAGNRRVGRIALRIWLAALVDRSSLVAAGLGRARTGSSTSWSPTPAAPAPAARTDAPARSAGRCCSSTPGGSASRCRCRCRTGARRSASTALLCLRVAGALLFGAHLVGVQRDFVMAMFGDGEASDAHDGRYNVLLLGGDSGAGRWGLRPDSMTVASIDAETGRTVLIGLPRNMANFPFAEGSVMDEQFPDGFDCDEAATSTASAPGPATTPSCSPASPRTPASTPRSWRSRASPAWRSTTGRWSTCEGFRDLVDAVGGVTLNVRAADPGRRPRQRRDRLHPARRPEAQRPRDALVRPGARGLRRLLADGPAEVRDERDAPADQPADRAPQLRGHRQGERRDGLHQHAGLRGRPVHRPGAQGPGPAGRDAVPGAAAGQHRRPRHRPDPGEGRGGDRHAPRATREGRRGAGQGEKKKRKPPAGVTGGSVGSLSAGYAANQSEDLDSAC